MTSKPFDLYIDRLKNDDIEQILESVEPSSLGLEAENELSFSGKIVISGQAYLAKNHLILDLKIKANAIMPCSICNEDAETKLSIDDFSQTVEICEIKSSIYNFKEDVRSAILLKVPQFIECSDGQCPNRKDVNKYLNSQSKDTHSPFSELESI